MKTKLFFLGSLFLLLALLGCKKDEGIIFSSPGSLEELKVHVGKTIDNHESDLDAAYEGWYADTTRLLGLPRETRAAECLAMLNDTLTRRRGENVMQLVNQFIATGAPLDTHSVMIEIRRLALTSRPAYREYLKARALIEDPHRIPDSNEVTTKVREFQMNVFNLNPLSPDTGVIADLEMLDKDTRGWRRNRRHQIKNKLFPPQGYELVYLSPNDRLVMERQGFPPELLISKGVRNMGDFISGLGDPAKVLTWKWAEFFAADGAGFAAGYKYSPFGPVGKLIAGAACAVVASAIYAIVDGIGVTGVTSERIMFLVRNRPVGGFQPVQIGVKYAE